LQWPKVEYILSPVESLESLHQTVNKIRNSGRVPLGVLSYDPRTDSVHVQLFKDIQDIPEANALLFKFGLVVLPEDQ
jgi:hypothetical protein